MADTYHYSPQRPHLSLTGYDSLQEPITTLTALLNAAQTVEIDTSAITVDKRDTTSTPAPSVIARRLRNRVSCRKTRLKRKLQEHALDVLVRERQERHEYLTRLAHELEVATNDEGLHDSGHQQVHDALFRDFAAKNLHYALVDQEYRGWFDDGNTQITSSFPTGTTKMKQERGEAANVPMRRSKRLRRARDNDVSTAQDRSSISAQASLSDQWRPLVDGLQNVDLRLLREEKTNLGAGVFDHCCHWRFVGVSSVKLQRDGEIAAVAVSGTTRFKFRGRRVQDVSISVTRREDNVQFNFDDMHSTLGEYENRHPSSC